MCPDRVRVVITSGQSNLTQGRIAAEHRRFSRIRWVAPWNTCFLHFVQVNPNTISICLAIFAQLTAECGRACPYMSFPLKIAPSHGTLYRHLIHGYLGAPESST